jgi:hypothetical protein
MFQNVNGRRTGKVRGKSGIGYHFQTTNFKRGDVNPFLAKCAATAVIKV